MQVFTTNDDDQKLLGARFVQGESEYVSCNYQLGQFALTDIPSTRRGIPRYEVIFNIDENGILNIAAKDIKNGKEQNVRINSSGLSNDEIDEMMKLSKLQAEKDREDKLLIDMRNSAEAKIYTIEKSLGENSYKIPAEVAIEIESAVADLRTAVVGDNVDDINVKLDYASKVFSKIGQHMAGSSMEEQY